jgi:hypothetical protein
MTRLAGGLHEVGPEISIHLPRHNAAYIEIPKVACTSLKVAFAQQR